MQKTGQLTAQKKYEIAAYAGQEALSVAESTFSPLDDKIIQTLRMQADIAGYQGNEKAEVYFRERARLLMVAKAKRELLRVEKLYGSRHPNVAGPLADLAEAQTEQKHYVVAKNILNDAIRIAGKSKGEQGKQTVDLLNQLAQVHLAMGKTKPAEQALAKAIVESESRFGTDHPKTIEAFVNLAQLYENQGKGEVALPLFKQALAACEETFGAGDPQTLPIRYQLGDLHRALGNYDKAVDDYFKAAAILENTDGSLLVRGDMMNRITALYLGQKKFPDARKNAMDALNLLQQDYSTSLEFADATEHLALIYLAQGQFARAVGLFESALEIKTAKLEPTHPGRIRTARNIAKVNDRLGHNKKAEVMYLAVLSAQKQAWGADHPELADTYIALAQIHSGRSDWQQAADELQKAMELQVDSKDIPEEKKTDTLIRLGLAEIEAGRTESAQKHLTTAMDWLEKQPGSPMTRVATVLSYLGDVDRIDKRYQKAQENYLRALSIFEAAAAQDPKQIALVKERLGKLYAAQGNRNAAKSQYQDARAILLQIYSPGHDLILRVETDLRMLKESEESKADQPT